MRKWLAWLLLAVSLQASSQGLFRGFTPDENGTNLDAAQSGKITPTFGSGTIIKDCAECPEMVLLPAGSFAMGSKDYIGEQPVHRVNVASFLMGKYEVTQRLWLSIMGSNPSYFKACGPECPVESVNSHDIQQFIAKLNQKTGQKYRLPSEAEWEYATRAGTATEWSHGNDESKIGNFAWYSANSRNKTQLVGQKLANAFGLFDMHGNVWEWTQDCWHHDYANAPKDGLAWETDCIGNRRVLRGGSYNLNPSLLRSTHRISAISNYPDRYSGFRLASDL